MSIYDRARDAFNTWTNGTGHEKDNAAIELARNSAAFAAEVVRLHDEFAALADELKAQGERLGKSTYVHERAEGSGYMASAARIRMALEGMEE